jgi:hypothetical protein
MSLKRKWSLIQKMKIMTAGTERNVAVRNVAVRNVDDLLVLLAEGIEWVM